MGTRMETVEMSAPGEKIVARKEKGEVEAGRVYVYFLRNDLHDRPFAFIEDVFVHKEYRGSGLGAELVDKGVERAKERGCYKVIMTCRHSKTRVHELYKQAGFYDQGKEFRRDL